MTLKNNSKKSKEILAKKIHKLLEKAKLRDKDCEVFGAHSHYYSLNPPISIDKIRVFEKKYDILLPEEYVYFMTEVGNGGAGPHCGLYSFELMEAENCYVSENSQLNPIITSELTPEKWEDIKNKLKDEPDDNLFISAGSIIIGTQGCTIDSLLMYKGSEAGKIVYIDWDSPFHPFLYNKTFLEWYIEYFESIADGTIYCLRDK